MPRSAAEAEPRQLFDPDNFTPVTLGPAWQRDPEHPTGWSMPEYTLGWHVLSWADRYLQHGDRTPWRYTPEQTRLTLWWFAVDAAGEWLWDWGVVQRLKGWGKDPLLATWSAVEFVGPSRIDPAGRTVRDPWGNEHPAGIPHPEAWVQIAAVSLQQTKNTMRLFPSLFNARAKEEFQLDIGKEIIYAHKGAQMIEAVTSSPATLEGARATFVGKNETQHWLGNNSGHDMADVIGRNADKSAGGDARHVSITNAYEPSEDSVAQQEREAWESIEAGTSRASRIMYDSLEAPPEAPLSAEAAPAVLTAIRGDSTWLNVPRLVRSIMNPRTPPSQSRRWWYNQIVAAEDAWIVPQDFDLCAHPDRVVDARDEIVLFFDGSKSDDATALVGCRVDDEHVITLGMWQRPPGKRGETWTAPRDQIDSRVDDVFERYNVVAFWGDPSHTRDDESQERYWDALFDDWHRRYGDRLELWAVSGKDGHAVMWDMADQKRVAQFTAAAERVAAEIEDRTLSHDGDPRLRIHVRNARRYPNKYGVSLWKGHRESARKIDLAVCAVGAKMLARLVKNNPNRKRKRTGKVW